MHEGQKLCGAKKRNKAETCKGLAMANGRCRIHGGKTPPQATGKANASHKYGIYSRHFTDSDKAFLDTVTLGSVDSELALVRLRLDRTVAARTAWEASLAKGDDAAEAPGEKHTVLVEKVEDQSLSKDGDVYDLEKKTFRLPDFDKIEQACLGRIESLEKTRLELIEKGGSPPGDDDEPGAGRDRITFTGGLSGGTDTELPSPFKDE